MLITLILSLFGAPASALSTPLTASRLPFDGERCGIYEDCVWHAEYYNKYSLGLICHHAGSEERCPLRRESDDEE